MRINANGIDINYTIEGAGPWLTMSHSLACNLHMWDDQMPGLTGQFKVLRFDTRGHDRFKEARVPALVMVGEHDHGTPPEMAQQIHANLPGSELKFISSAAHLCNIEQTQIFNDALTRFPDRAATTPK